MKQTRHRAETRTVLTVYRVDCWIGDTRDCRVWCLTRTEARRLQLAHERSGDAYDATITTVEIETSPRGLLAALNLYAR